jgi:predicted RNase H-like HicB family nuclease
MQRILKYTAFAEDGAYVARCLDVEVASEGDTEEQAVANLSEALALHFEDGATVLVLSPPPQTPRSS